MCERPKRYTMNDYNLGSDGALNRGSLEQNDGIEVPHGTTILRDRETGEVRARVGWAPWVVKAKLLGRNVRFALEWRAELGYDPRFRLVHRMSGLWYREHRDRVRVPFGWQLRKVLDRDEFELAPWWYFLPRDAVDLYWRAYSAICDFAKYRLGCLAGREGDLWSNHRWWPGVPTFSELDRS